VTLAADPRYVGACEAWLADCIDELTDEIVTLKPSEWAEVKRYLPPQVTGMAGYYSYDVAPYLREIIDCLAPTSPIRRVDIMKGAQVGYTVGVLENFIGYSIDHIKNAPLMMLTATDDLAKLRVEEYITPMLHYSGLAEQIATTDEGNRRKTGKTEKRLSWQGGGFLIPIGARSAPKLRSASIQYFLGDEIDAYPDRVGREGDPLDLALARMRGYEATSKIVCGSTPLITQTSRIYREYNRGDKRRYFVPCPRCGEFQELVFTGRDDETGEAWGLVWEEKDGRLVPGSVRYICRHCSGEITNDDKATMLPRGEWRATATSVRPDRRSYHISAMYSPVGFTTWENIATRWLEAWDTEASRPRDMDKLQEFYNTDLGRPFELRGEALRLETVNLHRRPVYNSGEIPNETATRETGGPLLLLTAAVDVHKAHLDVEVCAWAAGGRMYSVEWLQFEGDCSQYDGEPWQQLEQLIEQRVYVGDDGKQYKIQLTLVDSGYNADTVYEFCEQYERGVFPVAGRTTQNTGRSVKEYQPFETKRGTVGYWINVDRYKDRLAASLRREWDGVQLQPPGYVNFPQDYPEAFFKQLTVEQKRERVNERTGQRMGWEWYRPSNADNHAWDLTVYNLAALDMVAVDLCIEQHEREAVDWVEFWEACKAGAYFE